MYKKNVEKKRQSESEFTELKHLQNKDGHYKIQ
jgi:hypothetical protein